MSIEQVKVVAASGGKAPRIHISYNDNDEDDVGDSRCVELGLVENCRGKLYRQSTDLVELALKLLGLKVSGADEGVKNRLIKEPIWEFKAPNLLAGRLDLLAKYWSSPIGGIFNISVPIYLLGKWMILFILQNRHDQLIRKLSQFHNGTKISPGSSCVLPHTYDWWYLNEEVVSSWRRLEAIGAPFTGVLGLSIFFYTIGLLYPFILVSTGWWSTYLYKLRLDWLAFLNEPLAERRRIRLELEKIGHFMLVSTRGKLNAPALAHSIRAKMLSLSALNGHLNHRWHKSLMLLTYRLYLCEYVFIFLLACIMGAVMMLLVSNQSLQFRLAQVQCQRWNREVNLEQLKNFASLEEVAKVNSISEQDLKVYLNYERLEWHQYLYLLALVEPRYSFSWKTLLICFEVGLISSFCAHWFLTSFFSYLLGIMDKIVWLRQIDRQLENCIETTRRGDERPLLDLVAKTYMDYALFRSQFKPFRCLANLMIGQATLMSMAHLWTVNHAGQTVSEPAIRQGLLITTFASFFISLNSFVFIYSYLFLLVERAMKSVSQLLASIEQRMSPNGRRDGFELKFWREMWRRQLLGDEEMNNLYGLALFTIQVNFANFIQINVYPIIALTYLI